MRRFVAYRQLDTTDCGPACLRMVARHYGRPHTPEELRLAAGKESWGTSLAGLAEAARSIGLVPTCARLSLGYLREDVALPCIVHWEGDHFVVVYKAADAKLYVADPARGKEVYDEARFASHWLPAGAEEGYALILEPGTGPDRRARGRGAPGGVAWMLSYLRPHLGLVGRLLLGLAIGGFLQFVAPFLAKAIVDRGIVERRTDLLPLLLWGQLALAAGRTLDEQLCAWIMIRLSGRVNVALVRDFLAKLMKLALPFFGTRTVGDILQRVSDNLRVENYLTSTLPDMVFAALSLVVFGAILLGYSLPIFLLFLAGAIAYVLWSVAFFKRRRGIDFRLFSALSENQNSLIQIVRGIQEIKLNGAADKKLGQWAATQGGLNRANRESLALAQAQRSGSVFLKEAQGALITFYAAGAVAAGGMTLGTMIAVQFILGQMLGPVERLVQSIAATQSTSIGVERILEVRDGGHEEDAAGDGEGIAQAAGDLRLSRVCFGYDPSRPASVLRDLSLEVPRGGTTAVVGESGCGKTTLLKLMLGLYRPTSGEITVGGRALAAIGDEAWRSRCGSAMQDGYLFSDSIAENIALRGDAVDWDRLRRAARAANIEAFVDGLPEGFLTRIGAEGRELSQGQRQRMIIARALYPEPDFLFFDEATNALDADNERIVMDNLRKFLRGRTAVVVAHRLSTVMDADRIVVLGRGSIVEEGSHREMAGRRGAYYRLVQNQLESGS